jgi:hypothetical protein
MSRISKKKKAVVFVASAVALIGGGFAFAYWTTGGSGTGTAATDASVSDVTVNQTSTITGMHPGDSAQTLSGDFDNSNNGPVYVDTVTVSIDSVTKAVGAPAGTCAADDYTLTGAAMSVGAEVASGTSVGSWTGATIQFNDKAATNQDACKGATVNLVYTVS